MKRTNFTKRDFEFLAEYMQESHPKHGEFLGPERHLERAAATQQWENMVLDLAYRLQTTNDNFKQETFLKACGYNEV